MTVRLEDHYTGEEINGALERGDGFTGAFPGETADDDLSALRELFMRKALVARQSAVCERLLADGAAAPIRRLRVRDLPSDANGQRCLELREQLGIGCDPGGSRVRAAERRAADRGELTAGGGWRGWCGRASRPTAASAAHCCKPTTSEID